MKVAEIISIGDELLSGITVNTNAAYIGRRLNEAGFHVRRVTSVGDELDEIVDVLNRALKHSSVVVVTGGLGPTCDDITKKAISKFFDLPIRLDERVLERLRSYFKDRGRHLTEGDKGVAEVVEGAEIIDNEIGTAPGMVIRSKGSTVYVLPGVPSEMERMMERVVLKQLLDMGGSERILTRTFTTLNIAESELFERLKDFQDEFSDIRISFLPGRGGVKIGLRMITGLSSTEEKIDRAENFIIKRVGDYIISTGDEKIEKIVADLLIKNGLRIAVAESCTGGLIAHKLTNIPGSSNYFERGIVAYSNKAKVELLGVSEGTLDRYGAVSSETAIEMAEAVRRRSRTDIGLSSTGIAGPSGGSREKVVGLVYIGYSDSKQRYSERYIFSRQRDINKERFAIAALNVLRTNLKSWD